MDIETLLYRNPISRGPLSLLIRPDEFDSRRLAAALEKSLALLSNRPEGDEIVLLASRANECSFPARIHGVRIRVHPSDAPACGRALQEALAACRYPLIVTVTEAVEISAAEFASMLAPMDNTDVLVGRRRGAVGWLAWPVERLVRFVFSVPLSDPTSPVFFMRRAAVQGIPVQTSGRLCWFELLAKLAFLSSLVDEFDITQSRPRGSLAKELLSKPREWIGLWRHPTFWSLEQGTSGYRVPPYLAPKSAEPAGSALPSPAPNSWRRTFPVRYPRTQWLGRPRWMAPRGL